jgi:hypothetical protein
MKRCFFHADRYCGNGLKFKLPVEARPRRFDPRQRALPLGLPRIDSGCGHQNNIINYHENLLSAGWMDEGETSAVEVRTHQDRFQ